MARKTIYDQGGALSTIDGLLKDDYVIQQIQDQVNKSTVFFSRLKSEKPTAGRKFIFPVKLAVAQGTRAVGENQQLPGAGFGEYDQAVGNVKYLYSQMEITGQAIATTKGSKASFASALQQSLDDAREGLRLDMQRQAWSDGAGTIGKVEAGDGVAVVTTIAVTDPYGLAYAGTLEEDQKVRPFKRHMPIVILEADGTFRAATTITGVSPSTGEIIVADGVAVLAGDLIVRGEGTGALNARNAELDGLNTVMKASGTYLGIDRTSIPEWQANLVDAAGALTEAKMRIAMDQSEVNGVSEPDLLITDHVTRRRYEALLQSNKRFVNPLELEGGFSALEFDGKPLVVDKDAPAERIYFLRTSDFAWMMLEDVDWMDQDGSTLSRVAGKDAYGATLFTYRNLICKAPVNQTVLHGITA